MTDLEFRLDENGSDLQLEAGDLKTEGGLVTAVLVSLWSDARARDDDQIPDNSKDPRGYWGEVAGDEFGSRLWLYDREKATDATANNLREAATAALGWLIAEDIAASVTVSTSQGRRHEILLDVEIVRSGSRVWAHLWDAIEGTDFEAPGVRVKLLTY